MEKSKKEKRYARIYDQLLGLIPKSNSTSARMATVIALLHHKMDTFFWTGFYMIEREEMTVRMYQGPLACQVLEKDKGVCWTAFNRREILVVADVHEFPGHIACDSRSNSEIVIPIRNTHGEYVGVLDVDSTEKDAFDGTDAFWLEKIVSLIYSNSVTGGETVV